MRTFGLVLAVTLLSGCGDSGVQPAATLTLPTGVVLGTDMALDPRVNQLLTQETQALGDVSAVLGRANLPNQIGVSSDLLLELKNTNSPLLLGSDAPLQVSSDGLGVFSLVIYQQQVDTLRKEVEALAKRRAEQEAFITLTEPQVRALEKALGVTSWDRWRDAITGALIGILGTVIAQSIRLRRPNGGASVP